MDRAQQEFEAAGVRLVLIGQKTPRDAANFRRSQHITLPVLADKRRTSYEAAGAEVASIGGLVSPKVVAKGILATARTGRTQGRVIGHPAQLGASMLIAPDGEIAWSHISKDASDNAPPEEILEAVRSLSAKSQTR